LQDPSQPNNLAATILNVQAGRCRPLPPSISQGCRGVIAGLLNPNPEVRTRLEVGFGLVWLISGWANGLKQHILIISPNPEARTRLEVCEIEG
jgi:hypothetical protein